jgi:hypothetical protein
MGVSRSRTASSTSSLSACGGGSMASCFLQAAFETEPAAPGQTKLRLSTCRSGNYPRNGVPFIIWRHPRPSRALAPAELHSITSLTLSRSSDPTSRSAASTQYGRVHTCFTTVQCVQP